MNDLPGPGLAVEWGSAGLALEGNESGDLAVVVPSVSGTLVATIDGLGHGPEAATAAREAGQLLEAHAGDAVALLIERCHAGLRKTRGVVMSVALFDPVDHTMTWTGVGNVDGVLIRRDGRVEALMGRGGVVGYQLPPLRVVTLPVVSGDTLIFTTDGIRHGFSTRIVPGDPTETAQSILQSHASRSDDALVLVARYLGRAAA